MRFSKIYIQDNFVPDIVTDQFRRKVIGIEVTLNDDDKIEQAKELAEQYIKEYIQANIVYPDHHHVEERVIPEPTVLPSIQVQREKVKEDAAIQEYVKDIEQITDLKELKSWEAISKLHPEVRKAYEIKWILLKTDSLLPNNQPIRNDKRQPKKRN